MGKVFVPFWALAKDGLPVWDCLRVLIGGVVCREVGSSFCFRPTRALRTRCTFIDKG